MKEDYEIVHVIDLVESKYGLHGIVTYYNESEPAGAVGNVQSLIRQNGSTENKTCLGTNGQLNAMWSSPEGELWVVDDNGDVFTSAQLSFSKPAYKNLSFNSGFYNIDWKVTQIYFGQLNGIWGTSDSNVWVTSFAGLTFHWNGIEWQEYELPQAPNAIEGSACDDIYVVGYEGNIHHWNGQEWLKVALPTGALENEAFTDICVINKEKVYITARSGVLLVGNARDGFVNVGSDQFSWYGIGYLLGRLFLAGGEQGIFELADSQFTCLKDKGHPVGVFTLSDAITFIPAEQQPGPWFVMYAPNEQRQWAKINL